MRRNWRIASGGEPDRHAWRRQVCRCERDRVYLDGIQVRIRFPGSGERLSYYVDRDLGKSRPSLKGERGGVTIKDALLPV
jgi:hypothetical protein